MGADGLLAAVLQSVAQPVCVVDARGAILCANPAAIAALGYERAAEIVGRDSHETFHHGRPYETEHGAGACAMLRPRSTNEPVERELDWLLRRDGSMMPMSYVSVPVELPEGRGVVVTFTDIDRSRRTDPALRDSDGDGDGARSPREALLRRVSTLVAGGAGSSEVYAAIAREVAGVLGLAFVQMWRYEPDGSGTVIGAWSVRPQPLHTGTRWRLEGPTVSKRVRDSGRPVRIDDFRHIPGPIADAARASGLTSGAGAPIIVDGRVWGAMAACGLDGEPLPDHIEDRLAELTQLIAAAFSNSVSKDQLARLAEEQSALRRVATLVAQEAPADELLRAVAAEAGALLGADVAAAIRYRTADVAGACAVWTAAGGDPADRARGWQDDAAVLAPAILRTGEPARVDDWSAMPGPGAARVRDELGVDATVGCPIVVEERVWGALTVHGAQRRPFPGDTEAHLGSFADLVATAVVNARAKAEVRRLAEEQAALRRVATLVARERPPAEVFAAVAEEVAGLLQVDDTRMVRYEGDGTATIVADRGAPAATATGDSLPLGGDDVATRVHRTGQVARIDRHASATGAAADRAGTAGEGSAVGAPIIVDGRLWGALVAASRPGEPLAADAGSRIAQFTALAANGISNVQARTDLAASRVRIVAAADAERRRVVRDLHDGAQQRLVHTVVTLKLARDALERGEDAAAALVGEALEQSQGAMTELRELAHGILPRILTQGGLAAAIQALASRMTVPVDVRVSGGRQPAALEATAYFVVAEALTNVAKHARAARATVTAGVEDGELHVCVRDDGIGSARPDGSGLQGLRDRLSTLGGRLAVESPPGGGTVVTASIPVAGAAARD